jgi:hypothetical protein
VALCPRLSPGLPLSLRRSYLGVIYRAVSRASRRSLERGRGHEQRDIWLPASPARWAGLPDSRTTDDAECTNSLMGRLGIEPRTY